VAIADLQGPNGGRTTLGQATAFNAAVTAGTQITYDWDFSDGIVANNAGSTPSHTYASVGTFNATVTARNSLGGATATTSVVVNQPSAAIAFRAFTSADVTGTSVSF